MLHVYKDFYCDSDGMQITLYRKRITTDEKRAKEDNIGKERYAAEGYYTDLVSMIAAVIRRIQVDIIKDSEDGELLTIVNQFIDEVKKIRDVLDVRHIAEVLMKGNDDEK